MADYQIPASAIEAAARAEYEQVEEKPWPPSGAYIGDEDYWLENAEGSLCAAFDELGMEVDDDNGGNRMYRLRSKWMAKDPEPPPPGTLSAQAPWPGGPRKSHGKQPRWMPVEKP